MGHRAARLHQHQAALRSGPVHAPGIDIVRQGAVIEERIVTTQRKLEAVLALGGTVTGAGVAAQLAHDRHDILHEADLERSFLAADLDGDFGLHTGNGDFQFTGAIGHRPHQTGWRYLDQIPLTGNLRQPRQVQALARCQHARQKKLPVIEWAFQIQRRRESLQPDDLHSGGQLLRVLGGNTRAAQDQQGAQGNPNQQHPAINYVFHGLFPMLFIRGAPRLSFSVRWKKANAKR